MIPREILQKALADYEKAVDEIRGMESRSAMEYLEDNSMNNGLCYYMEEKFYMYGITFSPVFGAGFLGNTRVLEDWHDTIPALTARLQLRINKLKELLEK